MRDYERFLRAVAIRSAQLLNRSDLARDVGIAGSTLASWVSVLQASNQLALLEPWYGNPTVSLVKRPKLYIRDAGLAAFLCGIYSKDDLFASPSAGALWETLVCAEIRRAQINRHGSWHLNFWLDRSREADFLLHRAGKFHLADAKWAEHPRLRDASSLRKVKGVLPDDSVESMSVICRPTNTYPITDDVNAVPLTEMDKAWREG